mmetsp:Transcript_44213/g.80092  ORF Transcript_44213/g.80092 Transcript_44213/m.80092 type:complete len:250 (+) Transcript_44213:73-822(+)
MAPAKVIQRCQLPSLQEELRDADSPLTLGHSIGVHEHPNYALRTAASQTLGKQRPKFCCHLLKADSVREALMHDLHKLPRATAPKLLKEVLPIDKAGLLLLVWPEAADEMQTCTAERRQELVQGSAVLVAGRLELALSVVLSCPGGTCAGHATDQVTGCTAKEGLNLRQRLSVVAVHPPILRVFNLPGIMGNDERSPHLRYRSALTLQAWQSYGLVLPASRPTLILARGPRRSGSAATHSFTETGIRGI